MLINHQQPHIPAYIAIILVEWALSKGISQQQLVGCLALDSLQLLYADNCRLAAED